MLKLLSVFLLFIALNGVIFAEGAVPQHIYTLNELLRIAAKNHPLLRESQAGINLQKGVNLQTRSAYLPQINFNNSFDRTKGGSFRFGSPPNTYNSDFSLNQFIADFGKTKARVVSSNLAIAQAQENYRSTKQQVLFNVYQAYYQLLADKELVKVQENSVANLEDHLKQAESFFKVGTQPKIDVTQAEVNLSNGKLSLVQAQNNYAIAQTNLKTAVGVPDISGLPVQGELSFENYATTLNDSLNNAYGNRPDLKALISQRDSQQELLLAASKEHNPTLAGSADYGWNGSAFPPGTNSWGVGVTLNFPLFNGFLSEGDVAVAKAQLETTNAEIENLRLNIHQNVEQAFLNLESSSTSLKVAEDGLRFAKENYQLATGRYRVGTGNFLEYTDAEVALVQAQANEIQALSNYETAVAALKQAMGMLEEPRE